MIEAEIGISDEMITRFRITGHAGFSGENGSDIVCAAVSALVYGFMFAVQNLKDLTCGWEDQKDYVYRLDHLDPGESEKYKGCSLYLLCGLKALGEHYEENIKIRIKGEKHGSS